MSNRLVDTDTLRQGAGHLHLRRRLTGRLRARRLPEHALGAPSTPPPGQIDVALQRLSHASQLGLLLLAIFGYFYTVLPIYQKSLLDEDIARKTLELRAMENRLAQTEALLSGREAEFKALTKRVDELRTTADAARQRLGQAQAEVGKLKGAVQSQYSELRPRLLRDFQSLARSECGEKTSGESPFAECVERKVLSSPVLASLAAADRGILTRIIRSKGGAVDSALSDHRASIARRKQVAEQQARDARTRCEQMKAGEEYKDRMKKISIDHACYVGASKAQSELLNIQIDEMFSGDKVLSPHLSAIVKEFFSAL
jgi:hypothetical protein